MTQLLTAPPAADAEDFDLPDDLAEESAVEAADAPLDPIDQRLNDEHWTEYADGEFTEKNVSDRSSFVEGQFITGFNIAATRPDGLRLARVYDAGQIYRCWPGEPKRSRRPDASVVRLNRWSAFREAAGRRDPGVMTIVPDLAVEVVSPGDKAEELAAKLEEYRAAGFPLVWVVYPSVRVVDVYEGDAIRRLREGDELVLPDLLPAFRHAIGGLLGSADEA